MVLDAAVAGLDLKQSKIGKLCTEANAFVISDALGESEFEVEENEISLAVTNMVGEWGVFIPDAAAAAVGVSTFHIQELQTQMSITTPRA